MECIVQELEVRLESLRIVCAYLGSPFTQSCNYSCREDDVTAFSWDGNLPGSIEL